MSERRSAYRASRSSIDAAGDPSEWRADRVNGGMDAGVVPDILRLRPLPPPVEADDPRLDIGGSAPMRREMSERPDPLSVLDLAAHERQDHEELPQRIARTRELLDLRHRRSVVVERAEGDRAGEGMALGRDEAEGHVVGVDHQDPGRERRRARDAGVDEADLARGDARGREEHAGAFRPEVAEAVLPDADDLLRRDADSVEPDAEALVPQLTESLCGTRDAPTRHVRVDGVRGNGPDRERADRLGPVRLVARGRDVHGRLLFHVRPPTLIVPTPRLPLPCRRSRSLRPVA